MFRFDQRRRHQEAAPMIHEGRLRLRYFAYPVDILLSGVILTFAIAGFFFIVQFGKSRALADKRMRTSRVRRIICLNPMTWREIEEKGVFEHVILLNPDDYWDHFYLIHPCVSEDQRIVAKENITIIELKRDRHPTLRAIGFRALSHLLTELDFLRFMVTFIREKEIDVIKSQEPYLMGVRSLILRGLTGRPVVEDLRADYDLIYKSTGKPVYRILRFRRLEKFVERITFRSVDMVFAGSEHLRKYAVRNGADPRRTFTVRPVGVARTHFTSPSERRDLREELGLENKNIVLYCGRLHPEKHPEDVIKALPYVKQKLPRSILLVVGDGPQRSALEKLADDLDVSDSAVFLGFQKPDRVRDLLYTADVIIATMMGSVLVESALSSTPIVAYDIEWHSELIKNEQTGLLVAYRDVIGLASAVVRVLEEPEEATLWGRNAREKAISLFKTEAVLSVERKYFDRLLAIHHG